MLSTEEATKLYLYQAHLDILFSRPTDRIVYILELTKLYNRFYTTTTPSAITAKKKL